MRVISGSAKGHRLKSLEGMNTRPTQDRIKESLFNIIMPYIPGSKVLDLFSGTGNLGIEALSRGAQSAVLVDKNPACVKIINENLVHTKLSDKGKPICGDVISIVRKFKDNDKFDIVFMDPPYSKGNIIPTLNEIYNSDILLEDGIIIVERDKNDEITDIPFETFREQTYGITVMTFLRKAQ